MHISFTFPDAALSSLHALALKCSDLWPWPTPSAEKRQYEGRD
jgi:hypothetical protein